MKLKTLYDWLGRAVKRSSLAQSQTARVASLEHDFAEHPSRGLTPVSLAAILEQAEQGDLAAQCDLFEDMEEKDPHIHTEMAKRKRALLGLDWTLEPPRDATAAERKAAEQVTEWLGDLENFEDLLFDMADAIGKGYACLELAWRREGGWLLPRASYRPPRWFTVRRDRILLRTDDGRGEALWPFGWIAHVHKAKSGYVARAGLHRVLAWPYLFKNYSVRDLAEFLEIYGIPARIGTYPNGASEQEKATLLQAVMSVGHHAAGIMPEGMMLEFKEAASGAADPFRAMIDWCEASQSKAILGGTLTTTAANTGLGSNLGEIHDEVRHDLLVSDARQIAGTLSRDLVWPLVALNLPGIERGRAPRFQFHTHQPEDLATFADAIPKLVGIGMNIPRAWAHERLQIPEAGKDEPALVTAAPASPAATAAAGAGHACCGAGPEPDAIDRLGEELDRQARPAIEGLVDQIKEELAAATSLEDFQERMLRRYAHLDPGELADTLALAFSLADLNGRLDARS